MLGRLEEVEGSKAKAKAKGKRRGASREGLRALFGAEDLKRREAGERRREGAEVAEMEAISRAAEDALSSPRVTVHSPLTSAVLRYLKSTRPGFSMSEELRLIIEEAIRRKYPSISELVARAMLEKRIERLREKAGA